MKTPEEKRTLQLREAALKYSHTNKGQQKRTEYYIKNKEQIRAQRKARIKEFPEIRREYVAKRRARKLNATPKWLSKEDDFLITEIYHIAQLRTKLTNVHWHVDHILPLRGKLVSGLHVPNNLQVITAMDNFKKNAKYA